MSNFILKFQAVFLEMGKNLGATFLLPLRV